MNGKTAKSPVPSAEGQDTRRYRSAVRAKQAEQTRSALLAAATSLFVAKGWASTGMREIASEAGVATETLYAHFSSKRLLFRAAIDVAVVGDERPVALAERPEFAALGQGSRADRLATAARLLTEVHRRTAAFARVMREAAPSDGDIAELLRATRDRQRSDIASGIALIIGRPPTNAERDGAWAIASPEVYLLLVDESGWPIADYERWMTEMFERTIPRSANNTR